MASLMRLLRRGRDERGSELIELALAMPILLMLLAGIMDFGMLMQRYEVVTNAAREGARVAVLPNYTAADAQARVQSYLTVSGLTAPAAAPTVAYSTETLTGGRTITLVTVTVTYPSQFLYIGPLATLVGGTGLGTINLQAASSMRVEAAAGGS